MNNITRETFLGADASTQRLMLWDKISGLYDTMIVCREKNEPRISRLENRKKLDTAIGAGSGFAGGFFAIVVERLTFWK